MVIHTDFSTNCEIQTMRWAIKTDNKGYRLTWSGMRNKWSAQAIAHDLGGNGPGEVTARVMPWSGVSLVCWINIHDGQREHFILLYCQRRTQTFLHPMLLLIYCEKGETFLTKFMRCFQPITMCC